MRNMKQVAEDCEMGWVVQNLEIKLDKAKEKNPNLDFKEQETIVKILRQYRENNLQLIQDYRSVKKLQQEEIHKNFLQLQELGKLKKEVARLTTENNNFRENAQL